MDRLEDYYSDDPWKRFWAEVEMEVFDRDIYYFMKRWDPFEDR